MKILLTVASLNRSYGGPAFSVSQLANALASEGLEIGIWAPDGSAVSSDLVGGRITRLAGRPSEALQSFGRPDLFHDNGIWLPHNHQLANLADKLRTPRLVSVRGMLEPWARRHKWLKKSIAWPLYQRRDLQRAAALHATAQPEAENLDRLSLRVAVRTIPNGIELPALTKKEERRDDDEPKFALFLGRIYPVKGLPMLVEAWNKVRPAGWRLRIAGPDEAGHRADVEAAVWRFGLSEVVEFVGSVEGADKRNLLEAADLLVLPSHSESFGMVIGEALAHSTPVLTTTAAPWPQLISAGAGWWVPPTVDGLVEGLTAACRHSRSELAAMGQRGRVVVETRFSWPAVSRAMTGFYQELIAAR